MTVEKGSEWLLPENMKRAAAAEEGLYAAHKAYATGADPTLIEPHAIIDFHYAMIYARGLAAALRRLGIELAGNVLDIGCATGTVTAAQTRIPPLMTVIQPNIEVSVAISMTDLPIFQCPGFYTPTPCFAPTPIG